MIQAETRWKWAKYQESRFFSLQHHLQHGHVADSAEREKIHRNILELYINLCIDSVEDRAERDKAIEKKKNNSSFCTSTNTAMQEPV